MDPLTIGLLLLSLVGTGFSSYFGWRSNRNANNTNRDIANETNRAQALLAEQQHAWNVQDWQMQNAYNDPSAQMQRFRDAGLNPALIYGQMSNSPQISGTDIPQMHMAQVQPYTPPDYGTPFLSAAQSELALAQARKADVESDVMSQKLPEELKLLRTESEHIKTEIQSLNQQVTESARRIQSMDLDDQLKAAQAARIEFQSLMDDKRFNLDSERLEMDKLHSSSKRRLDTAQINNLNSITKLNNREYRETLATWKFRLLGFDLDNQRVLSEIGLNEANVKLADKQAELQGLNINAGKLEDYFIQESLDDLSGKNGWYHYFKTKMNLKSARDLKNFGDSGRFLIRLGK